MPRCRTSYKDIIYIMRQLYYRKRLKRGLYKPLLNANPRSYMQPLACGGCFAVNGLSVVQPGFSMQPRLYPAWAGR